jgi:hypothetical protein
VGCDAWVAQVMVGAALSSIACPACFSVFVLPAMLRPPCCAGTALQHVHKCSSFVGSALAGPNCCTAWSTDHSRSQRILLLLPSCLCVHYFKVCAVSWRCLQHCFQCLLSMFDNDGLFKNTTSLTLIMRTGARAVSQGSKTVTYLNYLSVFVSGSLQLAFTTLHTH